MHLHSRRVRRSRRRRFRRAPSPLLSVTRFDNGGLQGIHRRLRGQCQGESCCETLPVEGGTFEQGEPDAFSSTIGAFALDKYEVSVARFRNFVNAYDSWLAEENPRADAGANAHVPGSGWQAAWNASLSPDAATLKGKLACGHGNDTWAETGNDAMPITCVDWYTAFAFCVWDGGLARIANELESRRGERLAGQNAVRGRVAIDDPSESTWTKGVRPERQDELARPSRFRPELAQCSSSVITGCGILMEAAARQSEERNEQTKTHHVEERPAAPEHSGKKRRATSARPAGPSNFARCEGRDSSHVNQSGVVTYCSNPAEQRRPRA